MVESVRERLSPFGDMIIACSRAHGLDPCIVAGLVWVESSANPYAIRVERGFWRRYLSGIQALFARKKARGIKRWLKYPDLVSASYGLCQIMLPVAMEHGFNPLYPTELLEPHRNIDLGCQILSRHLRRLGGYEDALLRYNGGGNPDYPDMVLSMARKVRTHNLLDAEA